MRLNRPIIILSAVLVAVAVNLAIYAVGGLAGASFRFPGADGAVIPWFVVAAFSAVPLAIALTLVALLAPRWPWVGTAAVVAAPVLALVSIPLMPVPVGFDTATTVALSAMHVVVGAAGAIGVVALRGGQAANRSTIGSSASA